jgi:hypothetical protein
MPGFFFSLPQFLAAQQVLTGCCGALEGVLGQGLPLAAALEQLQKLEGRYGGPEALRMPLPLLLNSNCCYLELLAEGASPHSAVLLEAPLGGCPAERTILCGFLDPCISKPRAFSRPVPQERPLPTSSER